MLNKSTLDGIPRSDMPHLRPAPPSAHPGLKAQPWVQNQKKCPLSADRPTAAFYLLFPGSLLSFVSAESPHRHDWGHRVLHPLRHEVQGGLGSEVHVCGRGQSHVWLLQVSRGPGENPGLGSHSLPLALRGFAGRKGATGKLKRRRGWKRPPRGDPAAKESLHSPGRDQTDNWGCIATSKALMLSFFSRPTTKMNKQQLLDFAQKSGLYVH